MSGRKYKKTIPEYIVISVVTAVILSVVILLFRGCVIAKTSLSASDDNANKESVESVDISVYMHRDERTETLDLEEYLVGVVAAEMPVSFEIEALKAQAVAARTFTVRHMEIFDGNACKKGEGEICTDSSCCQAYKSDEQLKENWDKSYEKNIDKVRDAVYSTKGKIITYDGEAIEALYHSNSGGMTEAAVNVFSQSRPYLLSVNSPDVESSHYEESVEFSLKEFARKINSKWKDADISTKNVSKNIKILSRYESGRVEEIKLGGITVSGRDMRKLFELDSANFKINFGADKVKITTYGYGHGVGMSQYGANAMAKNGSNYIEILTHYYSGTDIGIYKK
ncbi:MAG: stage II sporulation protein D [Clostridia bacterium]|nr:stage II sporulation protein D [Clostridia bacterium]